jgi:hypothetical protein
MYVIIDGVQTGGMNCTVPLCHGAVPPLAFSHSTMTLLGVLSDYTGVAFSAGRCGTDPLHGGASNVIATGLWDSFEWWP